MSEGNITPEYQAILDALYMRAESTAVELTAYEIEQDPYYRWCELNFHPQANQIERTTMTKKDFQLIADGIKKARINMTKATLFTRDQVVEFVASSIADELTKTNQTFDRQRFLDACKEGP